MENPFSRGIPGYREYRNTFETDKKRKKPHSVHGILGMQGTMTAASYKFRGVSV